MPSHLLIELIGTFLVFLVFSTCFAWAGQNYDLRIGSKGVRGCISALTSIKLTNHPHQLTNWHKVSAAINAFLLRAPFRPFLLNVWDTIRVYGELDIRVQETKVYIFSQRRWLREYLRVPLDSSDGDNKFNVIWQADDDEGTFRIETVTINHSIDLRSLRRNIRHLMRAHHELKNAINFFVLIGFAYRFDGRYIFGFTSFQTNCWIVFFLLMTDGALYWLMTARPLQLPRDLGKHLMVIYTVAHDNPMNTRMILDSYPQAMCTVTSLEQVRSTDPSPSDRTNTHDDQGQVYRCTTNETTRFTPIVSIPLVGTLPGGARFDFLAYILTAFRFLFIVPEYVFMVNSGLHPVAHLIASNSGVLMAFSGSMMENIPKDHFIQFGAFYFASSCVNEIFTPSREFSGEITQFLQVTFSFAMVTSLFLF